MVMLRPLNVSMGLMLENVSTRLRGRGEVHQWAPDKDPAVRDADDRGGRRGAVPFTTGILLGIGETPAERAQSLIAIRDLHERYGHIQEVIIQNFRAKPEIAMADAPEPDAMEMARAIATARMVLGPKMNVQAPPNLSPNEIELFLAAASTTGRHFAAQQGLRQSRSALAAYRAAGRALRAGRFRFARAARNLSRIRR